MNQIEQLIITSVLTIPDYRSKVLPHLRKDLFITGNAPIIIEMIQAYHHEYKTFPNKDALLVELDNRPGLSEEVYEQTKAEIKTVFSESSISAAKDVDTQWMLDKSEKYLKMNSCHLAVMESLNILDGEHKTLSPEAIPDVLRDALSISFDTNVGHDYIDDYEARFEFYHKIEKRIPFKLKMLNDVTSDGVPRKSLLVPVAPTGVGKSLFMTDWASWLITQGINVLYVTLELAEERVAERIDANLMNVTLQDLKVMPKNIFESKINIIKRNPLGTLKIKEYPPGTFNANHLRFLLQDLKNKQSFEPDIIMVDYLNLMSSYRMRDNSNSYNYVKAIAEELRGVAMEKDVVVCSPTQTNRSGMGAADFDLTEVSESAGIAMTADMMIGFISTPDLEALGHMRIKQLKNRFGDINKPSSFVVSVNRSKMQLSDLDVLSNPGNNNAAPNAAPVTSIKSNINKINGKTTGMKF